MDRENALEADNLSYGYRRGTPVFSNFDAKIQPGSMVALTGASGSGKSTLLYVLAGMLTPWTGRVRLGGLEYSELSDSERSRTRAERCGFVFQDFALDTKRTIIDSVLEPALYRGIARESVRERALRLLNLLGVDVPADSFPGEISGGQAQRVALCRALLLEPRLVFADEPTGNLDLSSTDLVLSTLQRAADSGCAVVIATHDDRVVERCSSRLVLQ